jgi:hypothetical protein
MLDTVKLVCQIPDRFIDLSHELATADIERLAGDERRLIAEKKDYGLGNFLRCTDAVKWRCIDSWLKGLGGIDAPESATLLGDGLSEGSFDNSGCDRIDSDVVRAIYEG